MKSISFLLILALSLPILGQSPPVAATGPGKITGRVLDKDGVTPMQGVEIQIEELMTSNGRVQVRGRHTIKTDINGRYSLSGLYAGRVHMAVIVNNQKVITKGEKIGDEVFVGNFESTVDFDLGKGTGTSNVTIAVGH
jgi:hypothetical protein